MGNRKETTTSNQNNSGRSEMMYTQTARRLRPQTVFSSILEGGKSFAKMAPEYGMTEGQFEGLVLDMVGPKDYARLKKASDRNALDKRKASISKANYEQPVNLTQETEQEPGEVLTAVNTTEMNEEETTMEEKIATLNYRLANADREIETLSNIVNAKKAIYDCEKRKAENAQAAVKEADKRLKELRKTLEDAKKKCSKAEANLTDSQNSLKKWEECREQIEEQIVELENQVIYLVAPGFHGELPKHGTLIAVTQIPGATIESVNGVELIHQLSAEDIFLFDTMQEAKEAYNYVRLVMKYFLLGDKKYKLLVDSESTMALLKKQEVIDS